MNRTHSFQPFSLPTLITTVLSASAGLTLVAMMAGCPERPDTPEPEDTNEPSPSDGGVTPEPDGPPEGCEISGFDVKPPNAPPQIGGGAPDLSCLNTPEVFAASTNVTAQGCVDIFGIGGSARAGLKLAIFDIDQDPSTETPAYGEVDIAVPSQEGPLQELAAACPKGGYYRIENVPTHIPLIIKVFESESGPQQIAIPSYTYGIVFYDRDVVDGAIDYEASLIYKSTYDSIPTLGGQRIEGQQIIYDGEGRGVLAGEARDCNGNTLQNATVTTSEFDLDTKTIYFDGDLEDPTPDLAQNATNDDGLYAVLNVATDTGVNAPDILAVVVDSACSGDDCQCRILGRKRVQTFPDSVTLVSFEVPYPVIDPNIDVDAGPSTDAGVEDAGEPDAGELDAGGEDAGSEDAGASNDDAGSDADAGAADAG